jgi:predicted MFS family arabinose efflux permease
MDALGDSPGRAQTRENTSWPRVAFGVALGAYAAYQQFKLPPILPDFLARYPHSPVVAAGFMSVYALVGLIASAAIGRKLDRNMGIGVASLIGLTVIGVTLALAAPQSAAVMLLSRGLEGLAFAIAAIAGPALAAAAASPRDLPIVTGLLAGWIPMGQIGAALAALWLHDWHWLWIIGLALGLPLGLWAWALLRESRNGKAATRPAARHPDAVQQKQLILAGTIFMLWSGQYFAFMTWLTQYLTTVLALGTSASVLAYLVPVVVLLGCNLLTGWALRHGLALIPALMVALIGQALVWFAQPWLSGGLGLVGLIVYGIGAGVVPTCLFQTPHAIMRGTAGASAFGIVMTGRNIGVFIGPLLLATLIGSDSFALHLSWTAAAQAIGTMTLAAVGVALLLRRSLGHR